MDTSTFVRAATTRLPSPDTYDVAIAAVFVRVADRKGNGLPDDEAAVMDRLLAAGKPVVVACFGSPYLDGASFPAAKTWVAAFSTVDVAQRAVGCALFGQSSDRRAIAGKYSRSRSNRARDSNSPANPMKLQGCERDD